MKNIDSLSRDLLFRMKRLREIEEAIAEKYHAGKMRCPVHLSTGQEAVSAGVGAALIQEDQAVSGHRAHTHYLSKGGDLNGMLCEIFGKANGCSRGKGGSMHLVDEPAGFRGSTAIVGGTIPVGVGLGLSLKLLKKRGIAVVFLGDGAVEEGVFWEAVNFSVLKKLPVLFICENNFYSVYSHLRVRQPLERSIHKLVAGMGMPSEFGDGNDVMSVYTKVSAAVEKIRNGAGPMFFEFETYRWREHCGPNFDNHIGYRTEEEYLEWKKRDPITLFEQSLLSEKRITQPEIDQMQSSIRSEVEAAFVFAEKSPFPNPAEAYEHVYAGEVAK